MMAASFHFNFNHILILIIFLVCFTMQNNHRNNHFQKETEEFDTQTEVTGEVII